MSKFLAEGYCTEIEEWAKQKPELKNLGQQLIATKPLLKVYEGKRKQTDLNQKFKDDLIVELDNIIEKLKKI